MEKLTEEHKRNIGRSVMKWHKKVGFSKETRAKLSKASKNHTLSEEAKMKISRANKGKRAWNKGLTKLDIRVLKNSQRTALTLQKLHREGKLKPWNLGKPHTAETRKKISQKRKGKTYEEIMGKEKALKFKEKLSKIGRQRIMGKNNPMYGRKGDKNPHFGKPAKHGKHAFKEDLGHHCRSKWEANYSRFLLWQGKKYEYEPKTFIIILSNGIKATYTPDFLVNGKEWHEVKGWKGRTKIKKWELFQQQYKKEKFIFIDKKEYKKIERMYKYIIPNWEF